MSIGLLFWILMLLWLIFGLYWHWPSASQPGSAGFGVLGSNILLFILLFLLGWSSYGFIIQG